MISHSEKITSLMGAMLKVQGAVKSVPKDATNPHFKRSYASLESVVEAIRPSCQKNGLVVMQAPGSYSDGIITVETIIVHSESGEWIKGAVSLPVAKPDPQGVGSAITYGERYSLMALFNLPPVDDDGEDASRRPEPPQRQEPAYSVQMADNAADRKTGALIAQIQGLATGAELDELKNDPDTNTLYERLSLSNKALVQQAFKKKAASFAPPVMAG